MKYTNIYGLSLEIVRAITKERYIVEDEAPSDYSISDLINPIQMTIIKKKYPEDLVVRDVVDQFFNFMGSVAHQVLEDAAHENDQTTVEERLYMQVGDITISGKLDCYQHEATIIDSLEGSKIIPYNPAIAGERRPPQIRDYKTTKAYNLQKGNHTKWEEQVNCYAALLIENNKPVEELTITCLVFDWKISDLYKRNYPKIPIIDLKMPLWNIEDQKDYIHEKVRDLEDAKKLDLEELTQAYPCSQADMWQDFKDYAIIKRGGDRATKTFDDYPSARSYFDETKSISDKTHTIEKRVEKRKRCFLYCDAAKICLQHKELCLKEGVEHTYPNYDLNIEPLF